MAQNTQLQNLFKDSRPKEYPAGQIIIYQADSPTDLFLLEEGNVKVYDIDEQGNENILHLLQPQVVFPFSYFLLKQAAIEWFYVALTDVKVKSLPFAKLSEVMEKDNSLGQAMLTQSAVELHELYVRVNSMEKSTTTDKLAAALKFLALHHADEEGNGWRRLAFPVNHQLLADITGVTRESVTMAMKVFQDSQIVRSPKQTALEIHFSRLRDFPSTRG